MLGADRTSSNGSAAWAPGGSSSAPSNRSLCAILSIYLLSLKCLCIVDTACVAFLLPDSICNPAAPWQAQASRTRIGKTPARSKPAARAAAIARRLGCGRRARFRRRRESRRSCSCSRAPTRSISWTRCSRRRCSSPRGYSADESWRRRGWAVETSVRDRMR